MPFQGVRLIWYKPTDNTGDGFLIHRRTTAHQIPAKHELQGERSIDALFGKLFNQACNGRVALVAADLLPQPLSPVNRWLDLGAGLPPVQLRQPVG